MTLKHIISNETLWKWIERCENVRVIDCRFDLFDREKGKKEFLNDHIVGAQYVDLERDLSGKKGKHGGRHPLPNVDDFITLIESLGIDKNSKVVSYDDQGGAFASRFFWMMKYIGHQDVFVLNGGFRAWKEKGFQTTKTVEAFPETTYEPTIQHHLLATVEEVRNESQKKSALIVDSREWKRYIGEHEPIDQKAGHIPNAVNHFWKLNLNEKGEFRSKKEWEKMYAPLQKESKIIVYCGSGVTACPNVLAMMESGVENVKLYAGSFSDWISYEENEIETTNGKKLMEESL